MKTDFENPKTTEGSYRIPGGALIVDPAGDELYNVAHLREMLGDEEDLLANDTITFTERMHRIIGRCITKLSSTYPQTAGKEVVDPAILTKTTDKMLMSDTNTLLVRLRQVSLGDTYRFRIRCPIRDCRKEQTKVFDLSKFEIEPMKGDPFLRVRQFTTRAGDLVVWHMLTGADERRLDSDEEYTGKHNKSDKEKATLALMARVKTINGEPVSKERLKKIPMLDRIKLRKEFDDEGGMDMKIKVRCRACGAEFERDIPIGGEDFFTPSEISED